MDEKGFSVARVFLELVRIISFWRRFAMEAEEVLAHDEMKALFAKMPELFKPPPSPQEFNILTELLLHDHLVKLVEGRNRPSVDLEQLNGNYALARQTLK